MAGLLLFGMFAKWVSGVFVAVVISPSAWIIVSSQQAQEFEKVAAPAFTSTQSLCKRPPQVTHKRKNRQFAIAQPRTLPIGTACMFRIANGMAFFKFVTRCDHEFTTTIDPKQWKWIACCQPVNDANAFSMVQFTIMAFHLLSFPSDNPLTEGVKNARSKSKQKRHNQVIENRTCFFAFRIRSMQCLRIRQHRLINTDRNATHVDTTKIRKAKVELETYEIRIGIAQNGIITFRTDHSGFDGDQRPIEFVYGGRKCIERRTQQPSVEKITIIENNGSHWSDSGKCGRFQAFKQRPWW